LKPNSTTIPVVARLLPAQTGRAPVSARGARTRQALVGAARAVFERDGFLEARITDIAAEAGVAAGTFYTYFTSKEDAFAAVIEELSEEMLHPPLGTIDDRDDPATVIAATNAAYLAAYRRNAKLMGLLEQVAQLDEDFLRLRLKRAQTFIHRNAQALAALQKQGLADPDLDPHIAAEALSAMVSRMAYLRYVQGFGSGSTAALGRTVTRLWVNALRIDLTPAQPPRR
jgi:AcrR family transcriptional regulator